MTALEVKPTTHDTAANTRPRPQTAQLARLERPRKVRANALLVLVTMIWGSTFLITRHTLALTGPFTFLTLRFGIGAVALAVIFSKRLARISSAEIFMGSIIGIVLFATYAFQTTGLQYISSSEAGFISGLYVPLVSILAVPILRQKPTPGSLMGIALSLLGILLISLNKSLRFTFGTGEVLVLGCAFAAALHVIFVSKFTPRVDAINLAFVQIVVTALLSGIAMFIAREPFRMPPLPVWGSALYMGVAATAFALAVMNRVQQFISSTQATLIYALELVWVGMLGYVVGEQLSIYGWIGCACILLGMVAGEWRVSGLFRRG